MCMDVKGFFWTSESLDKVTAETTALYEESLRQEEKYRPLTPLEHSIIRRNAILSPESYRRPWIIF